MFCEENYVEQDIDLPSDAGYDRFLSLIASQVSSSPQKQFKKQNEPNKSTNHLSLFAIPNLPEQCVTSFVDNLQENTESNSRLYENHVIMENDCSKTKLLQKNNISIHAENIEQFVNPTKILIGPEITNKQFINQLSKFAAPPKRNKSKKKKIDFENRSDQSCCSTDTIDFPNVLNAAENQKSPISPNTVTNKEVMNLHTTNRNAIDKEIQWCDDRKYCHHEEPTSSQMSTHSTNIWKLSNDVTVPSNDVDLPKNWDNPISHKNISRPTQIGKDYIKKIKSSVKTKNKSLLSEMTIDESDKTASKKRFNQLKLSEMLPAKKLKNVDGKKSKKPLIEIISDINTPILNRKVKKNVGMWLSKINEFADTELLHGMDFDVEANAEITDDKNKKYLEVGEVINKKIDNKDQNIKPTETKSIAIVNKVQTVIANDDGKMKYKKMNEAFEYVPLTQLSCSQPNSKKKSKFVAPTKRDVPKKNINYLIENLEQESTVSLRKLLSSNVPIEIGITALFRCDCFH